MGTLPRRSLWLTVNNLGWVDRHIVRQWWFGGWVADIRRQWELDPAEPAILLLDNASSRADLQAMPWLRANRIHS
jgi:hypothetical protein